MSGNEPPDQPCLFCGGYCESAETCDGRQGRREHDEAYKRARTTDPETSHEAAAAIADRLRELQRRVLYLFDAYGPLTHHELIAVYELEYGAAAESTVRTRCAELVELGLIEDSGTRQLRGARHVIVWRLVKREREESAAVAQNE